MGRFTFVAALCGLAFASQSFADMGRWVSKGAPKDGSAPWGHRTVAGSHPTRDMPTTGVTRFYDLTVSRAVLAPDGVDQSMIVVNGQFPGPLLEANWGDWFQITVHNQISAPEEGTSMHWHGFNQHGTPFFDGVPVTAQCPIAPGSSLTYRFRADEYGTSWYHAHFSAQYTSGVVGPMVVHGPSHVSYDVDLEPILISDWYHDTYETLVAQVVQQNVTSPLETRPKAIANLVGGSGLFPCANITNGAAFNGGSYSSLEFEPGKTYRLRLVNTGSVAFEQISIDGHEMTVIANDFVPVQPYKTNVVTLGVGQRTDVLVKATGNVGQSFWFRAWNHPLCGDNDQPDGRAMIFYPGANKSVLPPENPQPLPANNFCQNDDLSLTVPVYAMPVVDPELTLFLTLTNVRNASGSVVWQVNGVTFKGDMNDPVLFDAVKGDYNFPTERSVYNLGDNSTLRIVFQNTFLAGHPMHMHGHDFQVLAEGTGTWDGHIINPSNPQRRDTQFSWAGANASDPTIGPNYMVVQVDLDNPGVWPFHCHIAWHLSAGMNVELLERPDELYGLKIPQAVQDTCTSWEVWQQTHTTDVIDARLLEKRTSKVDMAMSDEAWLASREALQEEDGV